MKFPVLKVPDAQEQPEAMEEASGLD